MTDEMKNNENEQPTKEESPYDAYGWDFHKIPMIYAAITTALLYAFIYVYIKI